MGVVYYCETCTRRDFVAKTLKIFKEQFENAKRIFVKPKRARDPLGKPLFTLEEWKRKRSHRMTPLK